MSKLGTCRWGYQIQEMWRTRGGLDYSHPHTPPHKTHEVLPEAYTCQWLDQHDHERLPPPIKRRNGGFDIRDTDCDACTHYEPAGAFPARR